MIVKDREIGAPFSQAEIEGVDRAIVSGQKYTGGYSDPSLERRLVGMRQANQIYEASKIAHPSVQGPK